MSDYTDAASRFGKKAGAGDDRALFLTEFGGLVIQSYDEAMDYMDLRFVKNITQGKADSFPIIGRKRDASEHTPGELILGGSIESNEIQITLDNMVYDSVFIAEIDKLISHFDVMEPYTKQLGQSLGSLQARRVAIMHILASRTYYVGNTPTNVPQGQPSPFYVSDANMKTSATVLETSAFAGRQYLLENEISGNEPRLMLPHQQYLLLARNFGVDSFKAEAGGGDRRTARVSSPIAGFEVKGTNHIPKTNITTGLAKYQGNFTTTVGHISSKVAVGSLERKAMRIVVKDQEERLGTIAIASQFNGHGVLRPEASIELATAVRS
ncbi:hypothetical protein [Mesorhizobium sp. WSM4982]|uniref:hypothetical protein n=1 Tax=Mesorhizobium sp. WSM4982 TaxID=3038550 RepID=UPI0024158215|nr:hypothetical protein [Mesorhizobium sp. WSM4982]MDG4856425.1 hypothetical protein [Mesorhizobium sp. WSM4982]